MNRREAPLVVVGGVELALVGHRGRERQGLAAAAGAEIEHLLAGLRRREQSRKLRALVLNFDEALEIYRLGMDSGALGVGGERDAQALRRPARRLGLQIGETGLHVVTLALQRVDAKVERRARSERRALLGPLVAEHPREIRIEPFGIV